MKIVLISIKPKYCELIAISKFKMNRPPQSCCYVEEESNGNN